MSAELRILMEAVPAGGQEGAQRLQHLLAGVVLWQCQEVGDGAPALLLQAGQEGAPGDTAAASRGDMSRISSASSCKHLPSTWPGRGWGHRDREQTEEAVRSALQT